MVCATLKLSARAGRSHGPCLKANTGCSQAPADFLGSLRCLSHSSDGCVQAEPSFFSSCDAEQPLPCTVSLVISSRRTSILACLPVSWVQTQFVPLSCPTYKMWTECSGNLVHPSAFSSQKSSGSRIECLPGCGRAPSYLFTLERQVGHPDAEFLILMGKPSLSEFSLTRHI